MRIRLLTRALALSVPLALGLAAAARADETFFCADGSMVTLSSDNREALQNHPCVKAWFADEEARRLAAAARHTVARAPSRIRFPVSRALALRHVERRQTTLAVIRVASASAQQPLFAPQAQDRPRIVPRQAAAKTRFRVRLRRR